MIESAFRHPVTVDEILDRQHSWLHREWSGYRATLRSIGSSSPWQQAPARRPPTARRGRRPDWGVAIGAAVLLVLALVADALR